MIFRFNLAEIAKLTFVNDEVVNQVQDYLLNKLSKDNPFVKQKCLRIIRHVCESGKPEFRRGMQRHAAEIKGCQSFRGETCT